MLRDILLAILPIAALLAIPFLLRPVSPSHAGPQTPDVEKLVIISAHNEAIRYEYEQAFKRYYKAQTGRNIELDFRAPGGTSDIVRYIADRYEAEFRQAFQRDPTHGPWSSEIAAGFSNPQTDRNLDASPAVKQARALFLQSNVGIGIDLMAGGGTFDMARQAARGFAVDGGVAQRHPELLIPERIPQTFAGDELYDQQGRYYGVVLSSFGICYNADRMRELSDATPPQAWADLGHPRFFNTLALADPTKSGSANKCFEIILQQCMGQAPTPDQGWQSGMMLIKQIFANARTLTDSAGKVPHEVASGNAAAGMAIDTYGFTEQEWNERQFGGKPRFFYVAPKGGTAVSADPVQLLRGAPHPEAAKAFIDFLLSLEGQKLHAFKPGTPGGPEKYALRRAPIRRDFYQPQYQQYRSDPDYNPYESGADFTYHPQWTAPYYNLIRVLIKAIALDPQPELRLAWEEITRAGGPQKVPLAWNAFCFLPFSYADATQAAGKIRADGKRSAVEIAATVRGWSDDARSHYLQAARLAKEGR